MGDIWFTSDTHENHANILKYCNRPFKDVTEMNEKMIEMHNALVKPEDTVYHLGDFCWPNKHQGVKYWLEKLNGKFYFIRGNHDHFDYMGHRVAWVKDYHEINTSHKGKKHKIILFHYPISVWNGMHHGSWCLHGHSHGTHANSWPNSTAHGKIMDVGVDCNNCKPFHYDEIAKIMDSLPMTTGFDDHKAKEM